jgi:glycosyltransferase involved in cell wall biosynthesis
MIERTPQTPPVIAPVPEGVVRPLWSIMIPTYNCSGFLVETIESVLANFSDLNNVQIEVVDDKSTDKDVEKIVREMGNGNIAFFQQTMNVGSLRNFETCINRARGQWIHILHGDDKVEKGFYVEIESLFDAHPEAGAAFTGVSYIDEQGVSNAVNATITETNGILTDFLPQLAVRTLIQPPSIVVKREVYEQLGSFFAVHYGEDWEMWVRIAAHYPVAYSPKVLAMYRSLRQDSISISSLRSGQNSRDIARVIDIVQNHLPQERRKQLKNEARRNYSKYSASCAHLIYKELKDEPAALNQARLALAMHVNKVTVTSFIKLYLKIALEFLGLAHHFVKADPANNKN